MHCACMERPYFHFQYKIWRHHRVRRPRFPIRRRNFGDSAISKGYIIYFYCACAKRPYFHLGSKIWSRIVFLDPDFLQDAKISAIRVHLRQIGLLNIFMDFWTFSQKCSWRAKQGKEWCDSHPRRNRFYFWGFLRLYQFWWKSIKKCDRESAHTHTLTDKNRL